VTKNLALNSLNKKAKNEILCQESYSFLCSSEWHEENRRITVGRVRNRFSVSSGFTSARSAAANSNLSY